MKFVDHILSRAAHPMYSWVVFIMTLCESTFLFVPPEVFMTPAIVADRKRAVPITIAAAIGSLIGGVIAYLIGVFLYESVGMWIIENFSSMERFDAARQMFDRHGILIIVLTAVTPIPYKLIGICAGIMNYPIWIFIGVSALFRTTRFAIVGFLLWRYQARANEIVKKYFWPLTLAAVLFAVIGLTLLSIL